MPRTVNRLAQVEEALEMIKSKVAYDALTEENRDVVNIYRWGIR